MVSERKSLTTKLRIFVVFLFFLLSVISLLLLIYFFLSFFQLFFSFLFYYYYQIIIFYLEVSLELSFYCVMCRFMLEVNRLRISTVTAGGKQIFLTVEEGGTDQSFL